MWVHVAQIVLEVEDAQIVPEVEGALSSYTENSLCREMRQVTESSLGGPPLPHTAVAGRDARLRATPLSRSAFHSRPPPRHISRAAPTGTAMRRSRVLRLSAPFVHVISRRPCVRPISPSSSQVVAVILFAS